MPLKIFGNKLWVLQSYKQITKWILFCFRRNIVSNWIFMTVLTSFGDRQAEPNAQNSSQQHKYIKFHGYDCISFRCRLKIWIHIMFCPLYVRSGRIFHEFSQKLGIWYVHIILNFRLLFYVQGGFPLNHSYIGNLVVKWTFNYL